MLGDWVQDLRYFRLREMELDGIPLVVSRTGWSSELGYELYLRDGRYGDELWERLMEAGRPQGLEPGHTSAIRRIEGGMLSYHADMDASVNPFELGLDRLVDLEMEAPFMGKEALRAVARKGVSRRQVGVKIDGPPLFNGTNTIHWPVSLEGREEPVGKVTSAVYSPRLEENIALALVGLEATEIGTPLTVHLPRGPRAGRVAEKPFYDPRKTRATG